MTNSLLVVLARIVCTLCGDTDTTEDASEEVTTTVEAVDDKVFEDETELADQGPDDEPHAPRAVGAGRR